ncbi:MAG: sulfotransferase [Phycisphaerae bacterium]|nr:sulfotransferase [Phycisphaerae bacterium]
MADTHQDILQSAAAAFNAGDVASAETLCRRALAMQPRSPQAWGLLGRVRTRLSRWAEAEDALNQALRLAPSDAETTFSLGVLRMRVGRYSDAVGHFERAEELNPRHPGAKPARASCLLYLGEARKALDLIGEPNSMELFLVAGEAAIALNEPDVAERYLRTAIERGGHAAAMYRAHQLLARILDSRGDFTGAFAEITASRAHIPVRFDSESARADVARLEQAFSAEAVARLARSTVMTRRPVFIAGMPRSGTTLLEKMIAAHPEGAGAGETDALRRQLEPLRRSGDPSASWPAVVTTFDAARLDEFANGYLAATDLYAGAGVERVADKHLLNWINLGMIAITFPHAAIVHIRRDPIDTGLSCFERLNPTATPWSSTLQDIGLMLALNERLLAHWHTVFPGRIIDVQYEDLVRDPGGVFPAILAAIGLPWNDACLRHHERPRREDAQEPPPTLSFDQVRRAVYDTSIGRATKFGSLLDPLREAYAAARAAS